MPDLGPAPSSGDGAAANVEREIADSDLVRVKVRWKKPGAASSDAASETAKSLGADAIAADLDALDDDARWAIGVARVAEMLQGSPYARRSELPTVQTLLTPLAGEDVARRELVALLPRLETLLSVR